MQMKYGYADITLPPCGSPVQHGSNIFAMIRKNIFVQQTAAEEKSCDTQLSFVLPSTIRTTRSW